MGDLNEGKHLYTLDGGDTLNALCFSPNRYWLCAATGPSIKIWDLEGKVVVDELRQEVITSSSKATPPSVSPLPGHLMDKLYFLDTLIILSEFGKCQWQLDNRQMT